MTPEQRNPGLPAILVVALTLGSLPAALGQTEEAATPPGRNLTVSIVPRAHDQSSYEFEGHINLFTKDITFDTPPEYQESFAFWGDRMKGVKKTRTWATMSTSFTSSTSKPGLSAGFAVGIVKIRPGHQLTTSPLPVQYEYMASSQL